MIAMRGVAGLLLILMGSVRGAGASSLDDEEDVYRRYCPEGVTSVRPQVPAAPDDRARELLLTLARRGRDVERRNCAWWVLSETGDERVAPALIAYLLDEGNDLFQRTTACQRLWKFPGEAMTDTMLKVLSRPPDDEPQARALHECAIKALRAVDEDAARARLRELLGDPAYSWCRINVIQTLGRLRDSAVIPTLTEIVRAPPTLTNGVRYAAAEALAEIGTEDSVRPLVDVVRAIAPGVPRRDVGLRIAEALQLAAERASADPLRRHLTVTADEIRTLAVAIGP